MNVGGNSMIIYPNLFRDSDIRACIYSSRYDSKSNSNSGNLAIPNDSCHAMVSPNPGIAHIIRHYIDSLKCDSDSKSDSSKSWKRIDSLRFRCQDSIQAYQIEWVHFSHFLPPIVNGWVTIFSDSNHNSSIQNWAKRWFMIQFVNHDS